MSDEESQALRFSREMVAGAEKMFKATQLIANTRDEDVNIGTTPLRDSLAGVAGTIVIVEDISSRVQLEEQLQISEKMASIGLLAASHPHTKARHGSCGRFS